MNKNVEFGFGIAPVGDRNLTDEELEKIKKSILHFTLRKIKINKLT